MDIQRLFTDSRSKGLFTDYDFAVRGALNDDFSGGNHISEGARLFDVASLTKACNHLLFLKLFTRGNFSPEQSISEFLPVYQENGDDRKLWHFLCYMVQGYAFDYEALRDGKTKSFKEELLKKGFKHWGKRFLYDNISSAYLGLLLEKAFGVDLEDIFKDRFTLTTKQRENFLFHPVHRGIVSSRFVVPTRREENLRGLVHDPLSFAHQDENIAVAGLFSTATTLADIFHNTIGEVIESGSYDTFSKNQLSRSGIVGSSYGLGFDIPFGSSLSSFSIDGPLVFAGWTGCRIFFAKRPRITICSLTNRVFCGDNEETRRNSSQFSWDVIRGVLRSL